MYFVYSTWTSDCKFKWAFHGVEVGLNSPMCSGATTGVFVTAKNNLISEAFPNNLVLQKEEGICYATPILH